MTELRSAPAPRETYALGQGLDCFVAIHRVMQIDKATTSLLKTLQLGRALLIPARIIGIKYNGIGILKIGVRGPGEGSFDRDIFRQAQEFLPSLLPERIIVFVRAMIFGSGHEQNAQLIRGSNRSLDIFQIGRASCRERV